MRSDTRTAARSARRPVHKQRTGATELLDAISLPSGTRQALIHVRDYTKGHPTILANNHPIRHGSVVGIHNGIIENDDELLAAHGIERAEPEMTVDSEVIFALVDAFGARAATLEHLRGAMATAWFDEREEGAAVAGSRGRTTPVARSRPSRALLRVDARRARGGRGASDGLRKTEVREGTPAAGRERLGHDAERCSSMRRTGTTPPHRSRAARGCALSRAPRGDRGPRLAPA